MSNTAANPVDPAPTPEARLAALKTSYKGRSNKDIVSHALGNPNVDIPMPDIAKPLVEHIILICVDTESHTLNTDLMTELGIAYISRKAAKSATMKTVGPRGLNLQEALRFFHFRIAEHAHLKSNRKDSLGPLGNRFGHTTFTTFLELRTILHHLFHQPITDDPELEGCICPIILIGHAVKHDVQNVMKAGLEYDIPSSTAVIAKVDTQPLAREVGAHAPPRKYWANEIGLKKLVEKLGFQHSDDHTACNDAARTMMCAIYLILPLEFRGEGNPSLQAVADRVEARSKITSLVTYGTVFCCTRCGGRDHDAEKCTEIVSCAACARFDTKFCGSHRHRETFCPCVASFKAWNRRYHDAVVKHERNVRAYPDTARNGPWADAHPWSTWPENIQWPLANYRDVLVGTKQAKQLPEFREPAAYALNMPAALGGIQVPETWGKTSPAPATASASDLPPPLASNPAPRPALTSPPDGTREVRMSDMRARGRGQRGRGGGGRGSGHSSAWKGSGDW